MALIGHGLVGLTMSGWAAPPARPPWLTSMWPGVMLFLAYAVDVVEWLAAIIDPDVVDQRFLSHAPWLVGVLALGVCVAFGVVCRTRRWWPYVLIVGAIFSHLLLDYGILRAALCQWYAGRAVGPLEWQRSSALPAEACVYGLPFVWTLLFHASRRPGVSRRARAVSRWLGAFAAATAWLHYPWIWGPVYTVSILHALIVLRRSLRLGLAWNVLPLLPLVALGATTAVAEHRFGRGMTLEQRGLEQEAIGVYETVLATPARAPRAAALLHMGLCYEKLGRTSEAERAYLKSQRLASRPGWADVLLADLYVRNEGQPFFRPEEAARLIRQVLTAPDADPEAMGAAKRQWQRLRSRGMMP
jgi:tetratricopeptide (TPR) repeat protein